MEMFTRRQIVMLRDDFFETLNSEEDVIDITDLLEVPREWASGNNSDSSPYARLKSLLESLNDVPEKMLELLNMLIHRENFWLSENFVNLVRGAGLDVIGGQKNATVVFATPATAQKKDAIAKAQTAAPSGAADFLDKAREALAGGDAKTCLGRCRDALESYSRPFAPDFINGLKNKGLISDRDRDILGLLWGYLSELGAHASSPSVSQGELGLNQTESCIIFLTRVLK